MNFFISLFLTVFVNSIISSQLLAQPANFISIKSNQAQNTKIYSNHWFGSLPIPKNSKNPLLIHNIFIISFDIEKKLPLWTAYHLSPALVWGELKAKRKYIPDPLLSLDHSLKFKDYKGASRCDGKGAGYDKGHLAPLGSFKASPYIYQAQYLSNIVPQSRKLNQGPWRMLEERVRDFVKRGNIVRILAGPLYGQEGKNKIPPCWKAAQGKLQEIPHSYWKIVAFKYKSNIKACSFLMPQKIKNQKDHPKKYLIKWDKIKQRTGLELFSDAKHFVISDCRFLF